MKQQENGRKTQQNDMLDDFFRAEQDHGPRPSAQLLERVLRDAQTLRSSTRTVAQGRGLAAGGIKSFWRYFGGWQVATALTLSLIIGVGLGISLPDGASNITSIILTATGQDGGEAGYYILDDLVTEG